MLNKKILRQLVKRAFFGGERLPARFFLAQVEPQQEVVVWLLVGDRSIDVTKRHCQASGLPFTICIEFARGHAPTEDLRLQLRLRLCERGGKHRILSEIKLGYRDALEYGESEFLFFNSINSTNFCLPRLRIFSHNLWHTYVESRRKGKVQVPAAQWERHCGCILLPAPGVSCQCCRRGGKWEYLSTQCNG